MSGVLPGVRWAVCELAIGLRKGVGAGDGLRTRYLNLGKVALYSDGRLKPGFNSIGAVLHVGRCCGAQPHSNVFLRPRQPVRRLTPVNPNGRC